MVCGWIIVWWIKWSNRQGIKSLVQDCPLCVVHSRLYMNLELLASGHELICCHARSFCFQSWNKFAWTRWICIRIATDSNSWSGYVTVQVFVVSNAELQTLGAKMKLYHFAMRTLHHVSWQWELEVRHNGVTLSALNLPPYGMYWHQTTPCLLNFLHVQFRVNAQWTR